MEFFCVYIGLIFVFFRFSVSRDGICKDIISRTSSRTARKSKCVSNLSCIQTEMHIAVSWKLPEDDIQTSDLIVSLKNVQTGTIHHSRSIDKNTNNYTYSNFSSEAKYGATVHRRYTPDGYRMFSLSTDCHKLTRFASKRTNKGKGFDRNNTDSSLADRSSEGINDRKGTTKESRFGKKTSELDSIREEKDRRETGTKNNGYMYVITGASAVICLALVIVVVIIVTKRLSGNGPKTVSNTTNEANNDQDNVYNHLSQDARDRSTREQTNKYEDEENTYSRLTLRYRDEETKPEPACKAGCPQQPASTDALPSLRFDANYDNVSTNNRIDNEAKSVTVKEVSEDSNGLMQKDHKKDDLEDLSTNDEYVSVDKHNSSQIDTNLDRKEGPKGDLYASVSIKR